MRKTCSTLINLTNILKAKIALSLLDPLNMKEEGLKLKQSTTKKVFTKSIKTNSKIQNTICIKSKSVTMTKTH